MAGKSDRKALWSPWYDGKNGLHVRFSKIDPTRAQLMWDLSWKGFVIDKNCYLRELRDGTKVWHVSLERGSAPETWHLARKIVSRCHLQYLAHLITGE